MSQNQPIQVADAVLVQHGHILLVQQRKKSAHGLWSYRGGHIEPVETPLQAVLREVQEEIGLELLNPTLFNTYRVSTSEGLIEKHSYTGTILGDIHLNTDELLAYGWFSLEGLEAMQDKLRSAAILQQSKDVIAWYASHPKLVK